MAIEPGTHNFGPDTADLLVRTYREGAAQKMGHDLVLEVKSWQGVLEVGEDGSATKAELTADSSSIEVREGVGGLKPLSDKDRADIKSSIDKKVLKGSQISFRSSDISGADASVSVRGDLELAGNSRSILFQVSFDGSGKPSATAEVRQSDWGIKPYSAMMGALKVRDTVEIELSAR